MCALGNHRANEIQLRIKTSKPPFQGPYGYEEAQRQAGCKDSWAQPQGSHLVSLVPGLGIAVFVKFPR